MKLRTKLGKWIIEDNNREVEFDTSIDAWCYIFIMRGIRPKVSCSSALHPVKSLNPFPEMKQKKVIYNETI